MALTVTPLPTNFYLKIKYGTSGIIINLPDPLETIIPGPGGFVERSISHSGAQETLFARNDSATNFTMQLLDAGLLARMKEFYDTHAIRGKQFELWLDRFTGPRFLFGDNLKDQNEEALTIVGAEAYVDYTSGNDTRHAFSFVSGNELSMSVTDGTHFDKNEGVIVIRVRPDFAGGGGSEHTFVTIGDSGATTNVMKIYKKADNLLYMSVFDGAGTEKRRTVAVSWSANTEQEIVGRWNAGTLDLWLNGTQATTLTGGGTGVITTLGNTMYVGSDNASTPTNKATGLYDMVSGYMKAFTSPLPLVNNPVALRTYFSKAELQEVQFLQSRQTPERELNRVVWTIREGV